MSYAPEDLEELAKKIQYDLTTAKTRLSELQRMIAEVTHGLPSRTAKPLCPKCGIEVRGKTMAEHLEDVHGVRAA